MQKVYLYVPDTMADWEPGHVVAELNSGAWFKIPGGRLPVVTVGADKTPVKTIGGLTIVPDMALDEVAAEDAAAFLLPGSTSWQQARHAPAVGKAGDFLRSGVLVAAICGATAALAEAGLLNDRPHTSNGLEFLELFAPNYKGRKHYRQERAVADGNLITAGAAGSLMWARLILDRLGVFSPPMLEAWYKYYDTADARYFYEMMGLLRQAGGPAR